MIDKYDYVEADVEIRPGVYKREKCIVYDVLFGIGMEHKGYMLVNKNRQEKFYVEAKNVHEIKI